MTTISEQSATAIESVDRALQDRAFALAVVDLSLVDGDAKDRTGLEVALKIREMDSQTRILIMSRFGTFHDAETAKDNLEPFTLIDKTVAGSDIAEKVGDKCRHEYAEFASSVCGSDERATVERAASSDLSGRMSPAQWDGLLADASRPSAIVAALEALTSVSGRAAPYILPTTGQGLQQSKEYGGALVGDAWSLGHGTAVRVCIGREAMVERFCADFNSQPPLERSDGEVAAAVIRASTPRSEFANAEPRRLH